STDHRDPQRADAEADDGAVPGGEGVELGCGVVEQPAGGGERGAAPRSGESAVGHRERSDSVGSGRAPRQAGTVANAAALAASAQSCTWWWSLPEPGSPTSSSMPTTA